jgi:ATP-dependent DNA helicase RecG
VGKLVEDNILVTRGRKKGTEYLINPTLIQSSTANVEPSLKTIELHRLKALIEEDIKTYPESKFREIQGRMPDVREKDLRKALYRLVEEGILEHTPDRSHRRYWLAKKNRKT